MSAFAATQTELRNAPEAACLGALVEHLWSTRGTIVEHLWSSRLHSHFTGRRFAHTVSFLLTLPFARPLVAIVSG